MTPIPLNCACFGESDGKAQVWEGWNLIETTVPPHTRHPERVSASISPQTLPSPIPNDVTRRTADKVPLFSRPIPFTKNLGNLRKLTLNPYIFATLIM
jgi:hypothetical protein